MATVVYRSCLESQLSEPKALRLRLSSPTPRFSQPLELALKSCLLDESNKQNNCFCGIGGLSLFQAFSCSSRLSNSSFERERLYVHPQAQPSSPSPPLSKKSLAMCTENLGNETGSDVIDNDIFTIVKKENCGTIGENRRISSRQGYLKSRKGNVNANNSYPPLLRSMIQVKPHREDGRLVLKATKAPSRTTCFQAERSNGRLRLCLLIDEPPCSDPQQSQTNMDSGGFDHLNWDGSGRCAKNDQDRRGLGFFNRDPRYVASS